MLINVGGINVLFSKCISCCIWHIILAVICFVNGFMSLPAVVQQLYRSFCKESDPLETATLEKGGKRVSFAEKVSRPHIVSCGVTIDLLFNL